MKALIDADVIAYRTIAIGERDELTVEQIIEEAIKTAWLWRGLVGSADPLLIFSGPKNYRKHLMTEYKSHRKPKPECYVEVVEGMKAKMPHKSIEGLEGDDVMGILQTSDVYGNTAILSIDKDMKTIPGRLVNPDKWPDENGNISNEEADYNWMYQTLVGDSADGFKGCPGIGPKKAEKALDGIKGLDALWDKVLSMFNDEQLAIDNARLARILRRKDYDAEHKRVKLWHPTDEVWFSLESMEVMA